VNVLVAILDKKHIHHPSAAGWFRTPHLDWAVCPFSEAGLLRHVIRPSTGGLSMAEATAMLTRLAELPGYHYQTISADWRTLCGPFAKRLFGHNQITDAYLLGLAMHHGLVFVTFDRGILHLAGEHREHVLLLETSPARQVH
jgi:predicted nucleic acid-binding protein